MKKVINWPQIIDEHYDEILEAIEGAYRRALEAGQNYTGFSEAVQLDQDGTVSTYVISQGSMPMEVCHGEAITICRFALQDAMEGFDERDIISHIESEGLMSEFRAWLVKEDLIDRDADSEAISEQAGELYEFRRDVWDDLESAVINAEMDVFDAGEILRIAWEQAEQTYEVECEAQRQAAAYWAEMEALHHERA